MSACTPLLKKGPSRAAPLRLITKADDVCKSLDSCADRISEVSSVGIASGYTHVSLGYMWSWSKGVTAITMCIKPNRAYPPSATRVLTLFCPFF